MREVPHWSNTLDGNRIWHGHIRKAIVTADAAGYPFVLWNDVVYVTATGDVYEPRTLREDLDAPTA